MTVRSVKWAARVGKPPAPIGDPMRKSGGSELASLRRITLRNNKLRELPESLGELGHLRDLDLRGNELRTLPDSVGRIESLERVDLRWNPIAGRPAWMTGLERRGCTIWR